MSTIKHAVIAAAGLGSRLGLGIPKCMLEVEGKPLIEYQLKLLDDVEDVRIVVGFREDDVIKMVRRYRDDVVFVRNPHYRITSTLTSYYMGAVGTEDNVLFMDADILFDPDAFMSFKQNCITRSHESIIGVTHAKTQDAVFVALEDNHVQCFSRVDKTDWEWANICYVKRSLLADKGASVFEQLAKSLPLPALEIASWEVDNQDDLHAALCSNIARHPTYQR